jgi:hypothetical protein
MCSVENTTNCTAAYKGIISFINNSMNSTLINSIFNSTYKEITNYYSEVNASGFGNLSIVEPLRYDIALFKSSKNISSKINAIVKMKEFPVNILFYSTGKMFNYYNETGIYGPFQFPVYKLINATSCNTSKIFNIVTDPKYFSSSIYTGLYKSLGNYTNICIITKSNNCNTSEMKSLYYVYLALVIVVFITGAFLYYQNYKLQQLYAFHSTDLNMSGLCSPGKPTLVIYYADSCTTCTSTLDSFKNVTSLFGVWGNNTFYSGYFCAWAFNISNYNNNVSSNIPDSAVSLYNSIGENKIPLIIFNGEYYKIGGFRNNQTAYNDILNYICLSTNDSDPQCT